MLFQARSTYVWGTPPMPIGVSRLMLLREVGRRGSIKAAAAASLVSASAVSQQLAILEMEARVPLLERHGRGVRLTTAGWLMVRHADTISDAVAAAEAEVERMRSEVVGELRIAAFPTAARAVMPQAMAALSQRHPLLRLSLRDHEAEESITSLLTDAIDIAIVDAYEGAGPLDAALASLELFRDPILVAIPPGRRAGERVALTDLASEDWIMDSESSPFHHAILRACRVSGFEPRIRSHCKDFSVILALVEAGIGVALVPGLALQRSSGVSVQFRPTTPMIQRQVLAVWRRSRQANPAIASCANAIADAAKSMSSTSVRTS